MESVCGSYAFYMGPTKGRIMWSCPSWVGRLSFDDESLSFIQEGQGCDTTVKFILDCSFDLSCLNIPNADLAEASSCGELCHLGSMPVNGWVLDR